MMNVYMQVHASAEGVQIGATADTCMGISRAFALEGTCLTAGDGAGTHLVQNIWAVPVAGRPSPGPQSQQLQ